MTRATFVQSAGVGATRCASLLRRTAFAVAAAAAFLGACARDSVPPETPRSSTEEAGAASASQAPVGGDGTIARAALVPILDAGLGRFLAGVRTEPVVTDGRFVGFRLLVLYPNEPRFREIDLRRGDVVTRVNGVSIERPEGAAEVWSSLRVASELVVEYVRGTETRRIRYAITN